MWPKEVIVYTDGASRGNPGLASIGVYVVDSSNSVVAEHKETLGICTNNVAEYTAVKRALELCQKEEVSSLTLRSDSELMVKQMTGIYRVKSPDLKPIFLECQSLAKSFSDFCVEHVRREKNEQADRLANEALDGL